MGNIVANGIDVSSHQKTVDWKKVKSTGIKFAILRAGFGQNNKDNFFDTNAKECIENDIPFDAYWFMYCVNKDEAVRNADKFNEVIKPYGDKVRKVWCDYEYDSDTYATSKGYKLTNDQRTEMVIAFCERMKEHGYEVGVYANPDYIENYFGNLTQYQLWLAHYNNVAPGYVCEVWQYSNKGKVKGINGNVDMNYSYVSYSAKNNPFKEPTRTLYLGNKKMTEEDIKWLQWELIEDGYDIEADGKFTKTTQAILRDYQHNHDLEVDGKCGPATRKNMIANKA